MTIINKNLIKSYFRSPYDIKEVLLYIDEIDDIFEYEYKNIKIIVYYKKKKDKLDINLIKRVVKRGSNIVKHKNFTISLLLTSAKKEIEYNNFLSVKNVNSGFTYINRNEIFIFRKEEFPKVIIHELIHHDINIHSDYIEPEYKKKLLDHFKLDPKCELILNEAIVELWATIIHLSNVSKEYNISFDELLKIELEYSLYKSNQILNLKLKSNLNLHYDNCNIYAYIIFKTIFFYYFNEFVKIYTFPYNNKKIVDFLISHSNLRKVTINPSYIFKGKKIQRPSNSLCFMLLSDL
jgi:hypothetical protein